MNRRLQIRAGIVAVESAWASPRAYKRAKTCRTSCCKDKRSKNKSDYQRAQNARMQTQTAGMPQAQADLSKYRQARNWLPRPQTQKIADALKRAPKDKVIHSYNADDGKVHFLYQKPDGSTYEKASDQGFYTAPEQ